MREIKWKVLGENWYSDGCYWGPLPIRVCKVWHEYKKTFEGFGVFVGIVDTGLRIKAGEGEGEKVLRLVEKSRDKVVNRVIEHAPWREGDWVWVRDGVMSRIHVESRCMVVELSPGEYEVMWGKFRGSMVRQGRFATPGEGMRWWEKNWVKVSEWCEKKGL